MNASLTPKEIADRFEEAARTLRRLPEDKPQGYFNVWPAIVRTTWEIMAMERHPMRLWATPEAISRMDEAFGWLFWLEPDAARIVWLRAEGVRWKTICHRMGVSRATAWRWWASALIVIAERLKRGDQKPVSRARRDRIEPQSTPQDRASSALLPRQSG